MQDKQLFEYAVIRVVPRVEREEFLNVGVIVYSQKLKYLQTKIELNEQRLQALCSTLDVAEVKEYLRAFERICSGGPDAGPIGKLDLPSRFRWLTATRSTIVQTSKVHPGFCAHPSEALQKLHTQLVL